MRTPLPTSCFARKILLSSWDAAWIAASPLLALYLRNGELAAQGGWEAVGIYWLITVGLSVIAIVAFRISDPMMRYFTVHDALDIYKAAAFAELLTCIALFAFTRLDGIPRSMPLIHGMMLATGLAAARMLFIRTNDDEPLEQRFSTGRVVLIGADRATSFFIKLLNSYPPEQQRVIAVLDERPEMAGRVLSGVRILGAPDRLGAIIEEYAIHGVQVEKVVIVGENLVSRAALQEIQRVCGAHVIDVSFLPEILGVTAPDSVGIAKHAQPALASTPVVASSFS
jgi:FlaA1/EpsC-like NDP-sugar epimerase